MNIQTEINEHQWHYFIKALLIGANAQYIRSQIPNIVKGHTIDRPNAEDSLPQISSIDIIISLDTQSK